jgi:hypothetical protein
VFWLTLRPDGLAKGTTIMTLEYVSVLWCDAHAVTDTWTAIEELDRKECLVESTGLLIRNAKEGHVVLAQSMISEEETVDGVLAIPVGMVRVIHRLARGEVVPHIS